MFKTAKGTYKILWNIYSSSSGCVAFGLTPFGKISAVYVLVLQQEMHLTRTAEKIIPLHLCGYVLLSYLLAELETAKAISKIPWKILTYSMHWHQGAWTYVEAQNWHAPALILACSALTYSSDLLRRVCTPAPKSLYTCIKEFIHLHQRVYTPEPKSLYTCTEELTHVHRGVKVSLQCMHSAWTP